MIAVVTQMATASTAHLMASALTMTTILGHRTPPATSPHRPARRYRPTVVRGRSRRTRPRSTRTMTTSARAVVTDGRSGYAVRDVVLDDPGVGEVVVEIHASGVCHTDADLIGVPVPLVLGHEGAGKVLEVGDDVTAFEAGQRVLLSWALPCGSCFQCVEGN